MQDVPLTTTNTLQALPPQSLLSPSVAEPPARTSWLRWVLGVILALAVLVTGAGWVIASPLGASPDDDYHLDSIWCPLDATKSCKTATIDGVVHVQVPRAIGDNTPCYAFKVDQSAQCSLKFNDGTTRWAKRYDDGAYPAGYYAFHHLLVTDSPYLSALSMRAVNVLIAVVLLGLIGVLMPLSLRHHYAFALLASWVPMGVYFIASNNPSSWSITGVIAMAAGMFASVHSAGAKRWVLFAASIVGAVLAFSSRFDAALYIFVVAAALAFAVRWNRSLWIHALTTAALGIFGLWEVLSSGRSGPPAGAQEPLRTETEGTLEIIIQTLMELPEQFGGFYGFLRGPGWMDVYLDGTSTTLFLFAAGGALYVALRAGSWRKWMSALMVFGAMCGIPIVMVLRGVFVNLTQFQPRYLLPLLAVLFFFLFTLSKDSDKPVFTTPQLTVFSLSIIVAHAFTFHRLLMRYVHGLNGPQKLNLNYDIQWWWDIPITPMHVWVTTSLSLAVALGCVVALTRVPAAKGS